MMQSFNATRGRRLSLLASAFAFLFLLAACGSDDGDTVAESGDQLADAAETDGADATSESDADTEAADADAETEADEPEAADEPAETGDVEELFPDVLDATATIDGDGSWTFAATLSSPYDTAERYADAWRVVGPDGEVYGIRELTHDHASEQPFTRSHSGIEIPDDVQTVTVEGRDQVSGWGGATVEVELVR